MIVVISDYIPDAVRGRLKLWFIEPRPNVFVSGIKDSVADKIIKYLFKKCPPTSGLTIFQRQNKIPGYTIKWLGKSKKEIVKIDGLLLIQEKKSDIPF